MSARVCNPVAFSEMSMLRSLPIIRRPPPNSKPLAKVKKDLFGPVDKQESKNFIDRQLADHNEALSKKWGFNFITGEPLQNHAQYQWERVPPTSAPACFTLTRVAHCVPQRITASENLLDRRAERENASAAIVTDSDSDSDCSFETVRTHPLELRTEELVSATSSTSTTIVTATIAATATINVTRSSSPVSDKRARRQSRITEFMAERKRPSTGGPKSSSAAKKARQMPVCSSSSSASSQSTSSSSSAAQQ